DLSQAGFTKSQIIDIIAGVFPSIGIANTGNGGYTCPNGHPYPQSEAVDVFTSFLSKLVGVVGADSEEIKASRAKIASLANQISSNNSALRTLEINIMMLQDEVEKTLKDKIAESDKIAKEQKEDSARAVSKCLSEYSSSNGEMTYDDFKKNLGSKLDSIANSANSQLSRVILEMVDAERKMTTLTGYLGKMQCLIQDNASLSASMKTEQTNLSDLIAQQTAANAQCCDSECQRTDPIGFMDGDVRYDFFIDKDNDTKLSNENEFLGAQNGFQELQDIDDDGDGIVDVKELQAHNVKVVVTQADGTQSIKDIADVFGEKDSINLNTYQALHADMGDNNILEGTFEVKKGDNTLEGYHTLDSIDWLDKNYDFSDKDNGKGRFAKEENVDVDALDYSGKFNTLSAKMAELRKTMDTVYAKLGLDAAEIQEGISNRAQSEANIFAKSINAKFEKAQEAKEAREAKLAQEAQEAKEAQEQEEEKKKVDEEEK
ncbi:hypothetical protein IJ531_06860, partial [bacterium]|nr:hypothetical protein [bacterium]